MLDWTVAGRYHAAVSKPVLVVLSLSAAAIAAYLVLGATEPEKDHQADEVPTSAQGDPVSPRSKIEGSISRDDADAEVAEPLAAAAPSAPGSEAEPVEARANCEGCEPLSETLRHKAQEAAKESVRSCVAGMEGGRPDDMKHAQLVLSAAVEDGALSLSARELKAGSLDDEQNARLQACANERLSAQVVAAQGQADLDAVDLTTVMQLDES